VTPTTEAATFEMSFTAVHGGPCPACGLRGELLRHRGTYGPNGRRVLCHLDGDGNYHVCILPASDGMLTVVDGEWNYQPDQRGERR
jgi:hypothetical protein